MNRVENNIVELDGVQVPVGKATMRKQVLGNRRLLKATNVCMNCDELLQDHCPDCNCCNYYDDECLNCDDS